MPTDQAAAASSASLLLQLLAITSAVYCPCWFILTLALLIYKATWLPYPPTALGFEIASSLLVWLIEIGAVKQVKAGNLTENTAILATGIGLKVLTCVGAIYYMWLQTYVMKLDLGFSATLLALDCSAIIVGAFTFQSINAGASQQLTAAMQNMPGQSKQKSE
jgi:transmembrane protein 216